MKLAELLTGPETWWRGDTWMPEGYPLHRRTCLMLGAATIEPGDLSPGTIPPGHRRMMRVLGVATQAAAIAWNDAPERTWSEVAAAVSAYDTDRLLNP